MLIMVNLALGRKEGLKKTIFIHKLIK